MYFISDTFSSQRKDFREFLRESSEKISKQIDYRIEEVTKQIEPDISRSLIVRNLAASINMSVSRFQHLFKKELNTSVVKYLSDLRMQKAGELLADSHLQVKEIRMKVGVTNEAHFLRLFKQKFGVTPNNYRKISRNGRNGL